MAAAVKRYAIISPLPAPQLVQGIAIWDGITPYNVAPNILVQTNDPNAIAGATYNPGPPITFTPPVAVVAVASNQPNLGNLTVQAGAPASALATKKLPIFDSVTGALIGYLPLYPS